MSDDNNMEAAAIRSIAHTKLYNLYEKPFNLFLKSYQTLQKNQDVIKTLAKKIPNLHLR